MSTQINVTVDSGGLAGQDKQRRQALRFAKVEVDNQTKVESKGKNQRDKARAQQGLDANGKPKTTAQQPQLLKDEPAAFRFPGYWFLRPDTPPNANAWFGAGQSALIPLRQRGSYPTSLTSGSANVLGLARPTYLATGGPNETPALSSQPSVGDGQDANLPNLSGTGMRANKFVRQFTLQMMFQLGSTFNLQLPWPEVEVDFADLVMGFGLQNTGTGAGEIFKSFYYSLNSALYERPTVPKLFDVSNVPFSSPAAPDLSPGVWHHAAMTFKDGVCYAFFNGALIGQSQVGQPVIRLSTGSGYTAINVKFGQSFALIDPAQPVLVHGVKFEETCRWTASFTPPPNLQ